MNSALDNIDPMFRPDSNEGGPDFDDKGDSSFLSDPKRQAGKFSGAANLDDASKTVDLDDPKSFEPVVPLPDQSAMVDLDEGGVPQVEDEIPEGFEPAGEPIEEELEPVDNSVDSEEEPVDNLNTEEPQEEDDIQGLGEEESEEDVSEDDDIDV